MTDEKYIVRVADSLQRIGLSGGLYDDGQRVHVTLPDQKHFSVSHDFMRLTNNRQLDYRVRYGAGLVKEGERD